MPIHLLNIRELWPDEFTICTRKLQDIRVAEVGVGNNVNVQLNNLISNFLFLCCG